MARKLYPIGIQTFERIRKEDRLYIDKTEYVYHMTHTDSTYIFLSQHFLTPHSLCSHIAKSGKHQITNHSTLWFDKYFKE